MGDFDDIDTRIYEVAFRADLWEPLLQDLAELIDAEGALVCNFRGPDSQWIASPGVAALYDDFFSGGWAYQNAKSEALLTIPHQGFICDAHHRSDEWMSEQAIYRDFYWPRGFGYAVATTIVVPNGDLIAVSIEKRKGGAAATAEELRRLDDLRPHLARTAMLAARLDFARIEAGLGMLQTIGLPAAMLKRDGRAVAANALFQAFSPQIGIGAQDRVRLGDPDADRRLGAALAQHAASPRRPQGRSFPLPAIGTAPPAVAHLLPIVRSVRDLFSSCDFVLIVTPLKVGAAPDPTILQGLFDLTPTEAKVAGELCSGFPIREIAARFGISAETVRSHVKSILSKSGVRRQVDFVSLMSAVPRAPRA